MFLKYFVKYPGISLNDQTKFALLSSIFHGMAKSNQNLVNNLQIFQVILVKFSIPTFAESNEKL
jgi:hypothetical protein